MGLGLWGGGAGGQGGLQGRGFRGGTSVGVTALPPPTALLEGEAGPDPLSAAPRLGPQECPIHSGHFKLSLSCLARIGGAH